MNGTKVYGLGPHTFPRGWFAVATSEDLTDKPLAVRYFAKDFVLYRGQTGAPVMLDAYCPHMGSHLASGQMGATARHGVQIDGDSIRCPLHGWRFGPDGKCKEIPYSPIPIPNGAHLRAYTLREHAGFVMMWHDEEDGEPNYDPAAFPEWADPQYLRSPIKAMGVLQCHPAEIVDHHVDKVHYVNTHGVDSVEDFVTTFDGVRLSQKGVNIQDLGAAGALRMPTESDYRGSGVMLTRMLGPQPSATFFAHTPVEDGAVMAWFGLVLRSSGAERAEQDAQMLKFLFDTIDLAFVEDMDVLVSKRPTVSAMQIPGDGPFRKVRTWYTQFYNPRAEAAKIQAHVNGDHITPGVVPAPWANTAA